MEASDSPYGSAKCARKWSSTPQFGIKLLASGENANVDIVAIHGIDGDREESWMAKNGALWLRDFLPEKIPNARVLTYGYDANTHGQEQLATDYMHDHAMTFIAKLAIFKQETSTVERPIIFVAHSSGGIMLKSALVHAHLCNEDHLEHHQAIARSTYGVAFFGTPHQGSATAELARFILDIGGTFTSTSNALLRHLERDSEVLQQQLLHYSAISVDIQTKFFYELYDTQVGARVFKRIFKKLVPKSSAVVSGTVNAEAIGINKDHVNMIKFASADDEDFKTVSAVLALLSKAAPTRIEKKWECYQRIEHNRRAMFIPKEFPESHNLSALSNLPRVDGARFDADSRPRCLEGTRVELLETISDWIEQGSSKERPRIFWLCGQAGTGKTTISLTVAAGCQTKRQLGASFFFSRDHADRKELRLVFPSLAQQLGSFHRPFKLLLAEILEEDPGLANIDPRYQFRRLIVEPLMHCATFPPAVVVIDALDECRDDDPISKMLSILSADIWDLPHLKFFITSRPEHHIRCGFHPLGSLTRSLILHDIEACIVDHDIEVYLRNRFNMASRLYPHLIPPGWPSDMAVKSLVEKSSGLFIFAATAMNFILDRNYSNPPHLLGTLLEQSPVIELSSSSPFIFLDQLYLQVLRQAFPSTTSPAWAILFKMLLGAITLLRKPLPPGDLEILLGFNRGIVRTALRHLHSVIVVPDTDEHPIRLIHPSFFDFATARCSNPDFFIDSSFYNEQLAIACFEQMTSLKRDICGIDDASKLNIEIPDLSDRIERSISPSMRYACCYWSYHVCSAGKSTLLQELLETFCRGQILYWIEVLSLIDYLRDGILQIQAVRIYLIENCSPSKELLEILNASARFIADYFNVISIASLQLYRSALPLSPPPIYVPFLHEARDGLRVLQGEGEWNSSEVMSLRDLVGSVNSVDLSSDGKFITFTSSNEIRLWDRGTGTLMKLFKADLGSSKVAFSWARTSPDGGRIISGASNYTVYIWNVSTGVCLQTIKLETPDLNTTHFYPCYTCSPDFTRIAGSEGHKIFVWDAYDGVLLSILEGHSGPVLSVAFSPNSLFITSGSEDCTLRLWDAINGTSLRTFMGHSSSVSFVAFSPDNNYLVSASWFEDTFYIWDAASGTSLKTFEGHADDILSIAFSSDGARIISSSYDFIRVWDIAGGKLLSIVACLGFENVIPLSNNPQEADGASHLGRPRKEWKFRDVIFSPDGTHIVGNTFLGRDIHTWCGLTGTYLGILEGHARSICSLAFSPDSKFIASGSYDMTVRLWDVTRRITLRTTGVHSDYVGFVVFSPDSTRIISISGDFIHIWDVASANMLFTIIRTTDIWHAEFTPDGSQIIAGHSLYDIPLHARPHPVPSNEVTGIVTYSIDGEWIFASKGTDRERCVWIPGVWRSCEKSLSHGRVAIGTSRGLVLLDLSNIKLSINSTMYYS